MIIGRDLYYDEEKYFSEYEMEDLYERAFSEGYEYAQKEFASIRMLKKNLNKAVTGALNNNSKMVNTAAQKIGNIKPTAELRQAIGGKQGNGKLLQRLNEKPKEVVNVTSQRYVPGTLGTPVSQPVPGKPGMARVSMQGGTPGRWENVTTQKAAIYQNPNVSNNGRRLLGMFH